MGVGVFLCARLPDLNWALQCFTPCFTLANVTRVQARDPCLETTETAALKPQRPLPCLHPHTAVTVTFIEAP